MIKNLFFLLFLVQSLFALEFSVATYNVENLFDDRYNKTEYKEYIPNTKTWNTLSFQKKLKNISTVINEIDADIIALQEIENQYTLKQLLKKTNYKYYFFNKHKKSAIGHAILSKFPIKKSSIIKISSNYKYRNILKVTLLIKNKPFTIYANHWSSKRNKESSRIKSAYKLMEYINKHHQFDDYVILGDLNENYDEYLFLKSNKRLNDTHGITAINHLLNTIDKENFIRKKTILYYKKRVHFNPWLELDKKDRFSAFFRKQKNTPDTILLSQGLFDNQGISYIPNSFYVYKPSYLFKNNKIRRWNLYKKNGFSDHLPIVARFTTKKQKYINRIEIPKQKISSFKNIYKFNKLNKSIYLKDCFLLYKTEKLAILKRLNDHSIRVYGSKVRNLKFNTLYDLQINRIGNYLGNTEIKDFDILNQTPHTINHTQFYLDGENFNHLEEQYLSNVIKNLKGVYKNNKLYTNNSILPLYFYKNVQKPPQNTTIQINKGIISRYKTLLQITIFKNNDYSLID